MKVSGRGEARGRGEMRGSDGIGRRKEEKEGKGE